LSTPNESSRLLLTAVWTTFPTMLLLTEAFFCNMTITSAFVLPRENEITFTPFTSFTSDKTLPISFSTLLAKAINSGDVLFAKFSVKFCVRINCTITAGTDTQAFPSNTRLEKHTHVGLDSFRMQ